MPTINKGTPKRPWVPDKEPFKMRVNNQHFYNSAAWRAFAISHKALNPLCANFDTCGGATAFSDHIRPISEGGALFDPENIQALCVKCNASKTGKQARKSFDTENDQRVFDNLTEKGYSTRFGAERANKDTNK